MRIGRVFEVLARPNEIKDVLEWRCQDLRMPFSRTSRFLYRGLYGLRTVTLDSLAPTLPQTWKPILDHCCMPPHAGWSTHEDLIPLLRIVKHLDPKSVLEFGTAHGNTV